MMRLVLAMVLVFGMVSAVVASVSCHDSERFGQQLVRVGDSERKVIQAAGEPDRERQLQTRQGGGAGLRMDYYQQRKTVQVYVQGGVVTRICIVRESNG